MGETSDATLPTRKPGALEVSRGPKRNELLTDCWADRARSKQVQQTVVDALANPNMVESLVAANEHLGVNATQAKTLLDDALANAKPGAAGSSRERDGSRSHGWLRILFSKADDEADASTTKKEKSRDWLIGTNSMTEYPSLERVWGVFSGCDALCVQETYKLLDLDYQEALLRRDGWSGKLF